jgi:putative heme-binding domain-containing protein
VLRHSEADPLIPHIVWQNLHPLLEQRGEDFLQAARAAEPAPSRAVAGLLPRVCERLLARRRFDAGLAVAPLAMLLEAGEEGDGPARECLRVLAARVQSGEIAGPRREGLHQQLEPLLKEVLEGRKDRAFYLDAALLAVSLGDATGLDAVRQLFASKEAGIALRLAALDALIAARDGRALEAAAAMLAHPEDYPLELRRQGLAALGRMEDPAVAELVLGAWPALEPDVQPQAIELLTGRIPWAKRLLAAVGRKEIPPSALNLNQVRKLLATGDEELRRLADETWGTVRTERNPDRERVIAHMRTFLRQTAGDPHRGAAVFRRLCGQCHKIYGEGQDVGPDITTNGRASFEQLLSNVFDPSLVIGAAYQARTLLTADGRVLTGLLVEESDQRIVLKVQGGKLEVVPRDDVEEYVASRLSLMPEDLERHLSSQELADLFAFLLLDRPPGDPQARLLPGFKTPEPRQTEDPAQFAALVEEVAPGFSTAASGEGGVAIVSEHFGRAGVLRTHPVSRAAPCILSRRLKVPSAGTSHLALDVSHDPRGDWLLVVTINGTSVHEQLVGPDTTTDGWASVLVDLTPYAGQTIDLALQNRANGWSYEFGYWGRAELVHTR